MIDGALVAALVASVWLLWPTPPPDRPLERFDVYLGTSLVAGTLRGADVVISPDGQRLAFVAQGGLFTRRLDQPEAVRIPGVERPFAPFFSPDGQWIGYFSGGLRKVAVSGGGVVSIVDGQGAGFGASWGDDQHIVASLDGRILSRVPADGGAVTPLTELAADEYAHRWPQVLPGGKVAIFTSRRNDGDSIKAVTLGDGRIKLLHNGGMFGRYLPGPGGTGYLLFVNAGALFAARFDADRLEVIGSPVPAVAPCHSNGSTSPPKRGRCL